MSTQSELVLQKLLNQMVTQNGQELHVSVGQTPMIRRDGVLSPLVGESVLVENMVSDLAHSVFTEAEWATLESQREVLVTKQVSSLGRFKITAYYQRGVVSITFRLISGRIPTLQSLEIPQSIQEQLQAGGGLIFVSGPLDSGRSTVSAAFLQHIMATRSVRVMTLEDPIEYLLVNQKGAAEQRQIGRDVTDFEQGIALLDREDVEVVFVSDVPRKEVAHAVLSAALSDHLVIVLMTSDSAVRTVESFVTIAEARADTYFMKNLSDSLRAVVNLRLLARQGNQGRVVVPEVLLNTPELTFALREADYARMQNVVHTSRQTGMITLDQSLIDLVSRGTISRESALEVAHEPERLKELLKK